MKKFLSFFLLLGLLWAPTVAYSSPTNVAQFNFDFQLQEPLVDFGQILNQVNCSVDPGKISYRSGGMNRVNFSVSYSSPEEKLAPYTIRLIDEDGVVILKESGETGLFTGVNDNDNDNPWKLITQNGSAFGFVDFSVQHRKTVTLEATIDGKTCISRSYSVIDPLTCSVDARVALEGENKNTLIYALNYDSPDDRGVQNRDIDYSISVSVDGQEIASDVGKTLLVEDGRVIALRDGESIGRVSFENEGKNIIKVKGTLAGKSCGGISLNVLQSPPPAANFAELVPGTLVVDSDILLNVDLLNRSGNNQDNDEPNPQAQQEDQIQADDEEEAVNNDNNEEAVNDDEENNQADEPPSLADSRCSVIGEGVVDSEGNLHIATALRYTNVPQGNFNYQLIGYASGDNEQRNIVNGNITTQANGQNGVSAGSLFTFDPANQQDSYVIHGLVNNLVCSPAVFNAPEQSANDDASGQVAQDREGNTLVLTGNRVQANDATDEDNQALEESAVLDVVLAEEFDIEQGDDAASSTAQTNQQDDDDADDISEYLLYALLGLIALLLFVILMVQLSKGRSKGSMSEME